MLTTDQRERLDSLSNYDWWEDGDDPTTSLQQLVARISSPEELWFAVIAKEWEMADDEFTPILAHPLCDRGIALMIYWASAPDFYYHKLEKGKSLTEKEQKRWAAIKVLEERLLREFSCERIAFDPAELVRHSVTDPDESRPGIRLIPEPLKKPTHGVRLQLAPHSSLNS